MDSNTEYSLKGRTETLEAETTQQLELTKISPEAQEKLSEFGLSEQSVQELRDITASFRYDLVPKRAEEIFSQNDVFIAMDNNGEKCAVIPNFYDPKGSLEGNCDQLGFQFITNMRMQSWLEDCNDEIAQNGGKPVEAVLCIGKSDEFFVKEGQNHVWVALRQQGSRIKEDMVDIDPALQKIGTPVEDNYEHKRVFKDTGEFALSLTEKVRIGALTASEDGGMNYEATDSIVLGVSPDRTVAYALGYVENGDGGEILPIVKVLDTAGEIVTTHLVEPQTGNIFDGGNIDSLSESSRSDIDNLLGALAKTQFNSDIGQFPYAIDQSTLEDEGYFINVK